MGKGYGSTTIPVHAGVVHDLAQLCKKFREKNSVRLADFCACFREMGFNEIWKGRQSAAELIEFSEKLMSIAATYMNSYRQSDVVGSSDIIYHTLEERMFGVYCSYAFFFLQPRDYVTMIRISPDNMSDIADFFANRLVPDRHLDTACCLYKLIDAGAFRIVPFKNSYDPAFHRRYDVPDCEELVTEATHEPFSLASEIANDPLLKQIDILQERYDQKKQIHLPGSRPANKIQENFKKIVEQQKSEYVDKKLRKRIEVEEDLHAAERSLRQIEHGDALTPHKSSKAAVKEKAYKSGIQYNKNRRYADPNQREAVADEAATPKPVRGKTPKKGQKSAAEETPASRSRGRPSRGKKAAVQAEEMEEEATPTLSVQEGRKRAAAKKKQQKLEAEAEAAGLLPPLEDEPQPKDDEPYTPLMLLSDPAAKSATTKRKKNLDTEDPEFAKILKSYEATADEKKALAEMEKLTGEVLTTSPKPKKRAIAPRTRRSVKKTGGDE